MKFILLVVLSVFFLVSCNTKPTQKEILDSKASEFKQKFDSINSISPYKFATKYVEILKEVDTNGVITEDVINRTFAQAFERSAQNNIDLCVEMIVYKLGTSNVDNLTDSEIRSYVFKLNTNNLDKIDRLIYNTFNLSVLYFDNQMDYLGKIENPLYKY
jgi:hypothetical protein